MSSEKLSLPTYNQVAEILSAANAYLEPAEAHGLLSGYACLNANPPNSWFEVVLGDAPESIAPKAKAALELLFVLSRRQLADFGFEFDILLPDDAADLNDRVEALAQWCQGLLLGLELGRQQRVLSLSDETKKALEDIKEMAKAKQDDDVSEESEQAYVELVEFARMTTMMIFTEISNAGDSKATYH